MSQGNPTQHEIDTYAGEFVLTGNKTASWRKAYPNSKAKNEAVHVSAQKMHNLAKVLVRIGELQAETAEQDAEEFDLSVSQLKKYLSQVIDAGLEIDSLGKRGGLTAVTGAIAELNRMNGNHAATKSEVKVTDVTPEQRKNRIAELLAKCGVGNE